MVVLRDQPYPVEDGILDFDFFRPAGDGPYPLVVFLHGGGWISGDKTMYRDEAVWLSQKGFACACPSYRLAPLYPFPTPVADCQTFIDHMRDAAEHFKIETNNVTVVGNSAGGHLALMLGLCPTRLDTNEPFKAVDKVVSICGISNICDPTDSNFAISMSFIEQFMDCGYQGNEEKWRTASPLSYVDQASGQFLLIHGTEDDVVPVHQSRILASALQLKGLDCKLVELAGEMHSFTFEGWERIRSEYLALLASMTIAD